MEGAGTKVQPSELSESMGQRFTVGNWCKPRNKETPTPDALHSSTNRCVLLKGPYEAVGYIVVIVVWP